MARYHGKVGFLLVDDDQTTGISNDLPVERPYFGRVLEHSRRWQGSDMVTDDLQLGNEIAIVANDFAYKHASAIKYCEFMGQYWTVNSVRIKRPEIILSLGGVYHGKTAH
jgi:hypothetical protein